MLFELLLGISLLFNAYLYDEIQKIKDVTCRHRKSILTLIDMGAKDFELIKHNRKVCDAICASYGLSSSDVSKKGE